MKTEEFSGSDEWRWAGEFEQSSTGLICKRCHAAVPKLGAHPEEHDEWCKAVEHEVRRQTGALEISGIPPLVAAPERPCACSV